MGSLKLPHSLVTRRHGGNALFPLPTSSLSHEPTSPIHPLCGFALSKSFITRTTIQLFTPNVLPFGPRVLKGEWGLRFCRKKYQPVTEQLEEDESKDPLVSGDAIHRRFLNFHASRGHKVLSSASLVPVDPTVLLTIAGMLQFKPLFLGKVPRQVPRAATAQRCIRTSDVENVGRKHTFFEMLGNFGFGDYFKKEAITWAWELSTTEFGLPADRLWVSIYEDDDEAFAIWHDENLVR